MGWNSPGAAVALGGGKVSNGQCLRVESIRSASEVHVRFGSEADVTARDGYVRLVPAAELSLSRLKE